MTARDPSPGSDGLTRRDRDLIRSVLARYPDVRRVTLFGSRAMDTFGRGSDIDLALEGAGLDARTLTRIATELEDSDLPYKVDLLLRDDQLEPKVEAHIRRHGKPFGWRQSTWGEEISLEYGRSLRDYSNATSGFRVFGTNGPIGWTEKPIADGPGVILGRKGAYRGVHFSPDPFFVIDTAYYVVPKTELDMRWLYYAMIHYQLGQIDDGSPIPSTTRAAVYPRELIVAPLDEQRDIARVLGALDDKIEQNRRTARALERLARAIFRAWFVDFEPVKAKAAGATSFPGMPQPVFDALPIRFVDSITGPVPEGWEVKPIAKVATFLNGLALQKYPPRGDGHDLRVIKIAQLRKGSTEGADLANGDVPEQYVINDGDLLFSWSGTLETEFWFGGKGALNQHLFKVTSAQFPSWLCLLWIRQHLTWFRAIAASKATTMGHIQRGHLQEAKVTVPPDDVLQAANAAVGSLYALHAQVMIESRKLTRMRDYLLPRLLSGDVRVTVTGTVT